MNTYFRPFLRSTFLWALPFIGAFLVVLSGTIVKAQGTLAYSFEEGLQGFGPNGAGITVTQDTIGATDGTQSIKVDIVQGATFVGALTDELDSEIFGVPPGLDLVIADLTITEEFPSDPPGFVDAGVTVFGVSQPDFPGGQIDVQAQFLNSQVSLGALEVGTHQLVFELNNIFHPLTFAADSSFNDIFGTEGSGPNDVIPTGFQIYINKSTTSTWTGYFDNIRFADAIAGDFDNDADVDGSDYLVWQRGETDPPLDPADLALWQANYGPGGELAAIRSVPEPSTQLIILAGMASLLALRQRKLVPYFWDVVN